MAKLSDKKKRWIKNEVKDFSFLLPSLVIFIIIIIIPLISGIRYTFTDWNGMSKDINYVGLKNYITVFRDKDLLLPIRNTAIFTLVTLVMINALGLGLAMMVEKEFKGVNVIKSIVFIPLVVSLVLVSYMWNARLVKPFDFQKNGTAWFVCHGYLERGRTGYDDLPGGSEGGIFRLL